MNEHKKVNSIAPEEVHPERKISANPVYEAPKLFLIIRVQNQYFSAMSCSMASLHFYCIERNQAFVIFFILNNNQHNEKYVICRRNECNKCSYMEERLSSQNTQLKQGWATMPTWDFWEVKSTDCKGAIAAHPWFRGVPQMEQEYLSMSVSKVWLH